MIWYNYLPELSHMIAFLKFMRFLCEAQIIRQEKNVTGFSECSNFILSYTNTLHQFLRK